MLRMVRSGNEREGDGYMRKTISKWDGTYLTLCGGVGVVRVLLSLSSSMVFYSIYMLFLFIIMASVLLSWLVKIGVP